MGHVLPSNQHQQSTSLKPEFFIQHFKDYPDQNHYELICARAQEGARIGYTGPPGGLRCKNWPSAIAHKSDVECFLDKNLPLGRVEGPLSECDLPANFRSFPLGAFSRTRSDGTVKVRVIHDLSYSEPPGMAVNDHIDSEFCHVNYTSVDHAVAILSKYDSPAFMVKCDMSDAFNSVLVHPEDRQLLGFSWPAPDGSTQYYHMNVLPFGLSSAPRIFSDFVDAIEWIIQQKSPGDFLHYLDDWWGCSSTYEGAMSILNNITNTCIASGFNIQDS